MVFSSTIPIFRYLKTTICSFYGQIEKHLTKDQYRDILRVKRSDYFHNFQPHVIQMESLKIKFVLVHEKSEEHLVGTLQGKVCLGINYETVNTISMIDTTYQQLFTKFLIECIWKQLCDV